MTLNVKNRIESDKKLVFFIVGMGFAFIVVGLFLLLLYKLYHEDIKEVKPVIVIGPCMLAAGAMCLFLSGEVCLRLYKKTKKVLDPDLDNIANPHEVKHWMDPKLIPFGWGLFEVDDEIIVIEKGTLSSDLFTMLNTLNLQTLMQWRYHCRFSSRERNTNRKM